MGYGAACWAGMQALASDIAVIAFLDADLADDPQRLPMLVEPILAGDADLVIGSRTKDLREPRSMTPQQVFGNWLATRLIHLGWGHRYSDLGPFRAVRASKLLALEMRDRRFGWTVEMQIRAIEEEFRVEEVPMPYRQRVGRSKISGTVKGTVLAGYWILKTVGTLWVRKRGQQQRSKPDSRPGM